MKVVIIGGVAGGATAAARLRRLDEEAQIVMIERSGFVSYANCGLPYYIGGEIQEKSKLTLQTPQSFFRRFRIDVRTRQEAVKIDRETKRVLVKNLGDKSLYWESYDKLILSPGARPMVPNLPGIDIDGIMTLRTVEDTFQIWEYAEKNKPSSAIVIGGGFIGLEMAENLKKRGISVSLFQRGNHVMPPLDEDMAALVHTYMRKKGIQLFLNAEVTGFAKAENGIQVSVGGKQYHTDLVIIAVGVRPESTIAREAGLTLGTKDAIVTNARMQTSDPDIYAVGDAVEVTHFVSGKKAVISLAGPANKQGRIAADNICGLCSTYKGSQGSSVLKLFDMAIAATGYNAREANREGYSYDSVVLTMPSHAAYYPGASNMIMKVIFEKPSGRILGAQIVGYEGADKRIDVLATAIRARMTAYDLTELDLAYAPPFSSAKDPVNMAGYAIENILSGKVRQIYWDEALNAGDDALLLDTRTQGEFDRGHIAGAMHIPVDELRERIDELPFDKAIYIYCQSGLRSYIACRILAQKGYSCYNISGGYGFYEGIRQGGAVCEDGTGPCGLKQ